MSKNMGNGSVPSKEARSKGVANWVQEAIRKTTMNKFTLAALLTLPLLAVGQQRAAADGWGFGWTNRGGAGCATCNGGAPTGNSAPQGCATCGKGGCGVGCCGPLGCFPVSLGAVSNFFHSPPPWAGLCTRGCGGPGKNDCCGKVPGPWYLYWPDPRGVGIQTGPAYPNWTYESNFTGSVMGFNPAGARPQYPSYWYGR